MFGNETLEIQAIIKADPYLEAQDISLNIIYEDDHILIINKSHDMVVHPGAGNPNGTILNALLHYFPPIVNVPRAGIVHRLDKNTSGLMVVAKTISAYTYLVRSFKAREITREYEAIAIGNMMTGGTINQPISRHVIKRTYMTVSPLGKPAITHYSIIENFRAHTYLRLRLETGRTHQIRVHMAYINHPLVGDPLYSRNQGRFRIPKDASKKFKIGLQNFHRQALHASFLRLYHPITLIEMKWHALLPQDMLILIEVLKKDMKIFNNKY